MTREGQTAVNISEELLAAYRGTDFHVNADSPFIFNIDEFSIGLDFLHTKYDVRSSAMITAHNPYSHLHSSAYNEQAQIQLCESIKHLGYKWLEGEGKDPSGEWPGEPSVLVLGCELVEVRSLGEIFKQNAIVWIDNEAIPQLVILRE